jgi:glutamate/tyrosine decarboxylase-like PLP-dependent enzyme
MSFDRAGLPLLDEALAALEAGFAHLPDAAPQVDPAPLRAALLATAERLRDNDPYHHPLYLGHMLKPPHPAARLAYSLALWLNPNNHAFDGGRASSLMEQEAVAEIAGMFGWKNFLGHLCSGGTLANFEALWIARETTQVSTQESTQETTQKQGQQPGRAIAASAQAHYTHARLSDVLGVPFQPVPTDRFGRMDIPALEDLLASGQIGTVVASLGTTGTGSVDPLDEIVALRARHAFRLHVDAAYGGYFTLADNLAPATRQAFDAIGAADSIAIDPHKHGLQPYGCGCILFRDTDVKRHYRHDSPYTYLDSDDPHLGEISLECSRPGAAAVALWTTQQMLPLHPGGEFAQGLQAGRAAALALHRALTEDERFNRRFAPLFTPELDIVTWAVKAETASAATQRARQLQQAAKAHDLHLALASFPRALLEAAHPVQHWDTDQITCLRACVMKPEHRDWMEEILLRLKTAADESLG